MATRHAHTWAGPGAPAASLSSWWCPPRGGGETLRAHPAHMVRVVWFGLPPASHSWEGGGNDDAPSPLPHGGPVSSTLPLRAVGVVVGPGCVQGSPAATPGVLGAAASSTARLPGPDALPVGSPVCLTQANSYYQPYGAGAHYYGGYQPTSYVAPGGYPVSGVWYGQGACRVAHQPRLCPAGGGEGGDVAVCDVARASSGDVIG